MMLMSACLLEKTDVAVAFSHSGQTAVVIDAVRQARRNGTRIIAVTNRRSSILAQESDVVLCSNVEESLITGENAACANRAANYCRCFVSRRRPTELWN